MIYVREGWLGVWHVMNGNRTRCGLRPLETDCRCTERPAHVCAACECTNNRAEGIGERDPVDTGPGRARIRSGLR